MPFSIFLIKTTGKAHPLHGNNAHPLPLTYHAEQLFKQDTLVGGRDFAEASEHRVGKMGGLGNGCPACLGQVDCVAAGIFFFGMPLDEAFLFERFHRLADGGLGQAKFLGQITDLAFFIAMKLDKNQNLDLYRADAQNLGFFPEQHPETLAEPFEGGDDFQVGVANLGLWVENAIVHRLKKGTVGLVLPPRKIRSPNYFYQKISRTLPSR